MKDPHLEIERKFLVREMPRGLERLPQREIEQGYLVVNKTRKCACAELDGNVI